MKTPYHNLGVQEARRSQISAYRAEISVKGGHAFCGSPAATIAFSRPPTTQRSVPSIQWREPWVTGSRTGKRHPELEVSQLQTTYLRDENQGNTSSIHREKSSPDLHSAERNTLLLLSITLSSYLMKV
ncbi:hypothetical protein H2248_012010 [Termitomyces sp. 'cryptogamus']|nr:hypothetical protein H2248_012010 [Termitomyces sp. 'cryptogamus']